MTKMTEWVKAVLWPRIRAATAGIASEWWNDIADQPRPHFVSMVFGIVLYFAIQFAVWLAA